ncbi:intraflagellar transport protein 46 homolog [Copidosoma floridanum]|uniref:intraflagellar transport protein 46 homolog n=1 Tax=Copidosoma floridanum TaxID=29053 RepID=UPI0006C9CF03|nr:intraflagellar transport protein 46 homolog [Copidosoma floridanum]
MQRRSAESSNGHPLDRQLRASSEEEEEHRSQEVGAFSTVDRSVEVENAAKETTSRPASGRRPTNSSRTTRPKPDPHDADVRSPATKAADFRRYSVPDDSFNKSMGLDSETSDSEDSEDVDVQKIARMKLADYYDSKQFEDLNVSAEVKELFQNITRYTPQKMDLQYKLIPLIPDYIPAVGDIDAFLKVPRPDEAPDKLGLAVLDEPAADQSEPAVLHLQLRSRSRSAVSSSKASVVKRLEDASRQGRLIDKWIDDMNQLHRSKHPPAVQLTNRYPSPDALLEPWPLEIEDKLNLVHAPNLLQLDLDLLQLVDVICAVLDIPVYGDNKIEALHVLFALYTEVHNIDVQKIHA